MALKRTTSADTDFQALVNQLDVFLADLNGADHAFYNQFNGIAALQHVVVAYIDNIPVGCGAFKPFDANSVEIKRMYVDPVHRGKGIAGSILTNLEAWSREFGYDACVLETSVKLAAANHLYAQSGYEPIPKYGQYVNMPDSVCFRKDLTA